MKQRNFKLSMLILSILPAQTSFSDDFKAQVDGLKKNQAALDQMIGPYRALGGFKESKNPFLAKDEEQKPSLLHFHNSPSKLQAPIGKFLFGRTLNRLVVGTEKNPAIIQIKPDQGSFSDLRFMGTATQASTPGRVAIEIQRVVFKGGSSKALAALALDRNGALGVEAHVVACLID